MSPGEERIRKLVEDYDDEAEATGWLGPEIAFGMIHEHILAGQSVLDIGIGTGLGSVPFRNARLRVYGMDISEDMLAACRTKGFVDLTRHDLTECPYPFASESFDHTVCLGVLNFFSDLSPVFAETARVLRTRSMFVFEVGDRTEDEDFEFVVGPEHTGSGAPVTMYRHSSRQIEEWSDRYGFILLGSRPFAVYMDRTKKESMRAKCYLVQKATVSDDPGGALGGTETS